VNPKLTAQQWLAGLLALASGLCAITLALFRSRLDPATHDLLLSAGGACAFLASTLALRPTKTPAPALPEASKGNDHE